MEQGVNALRSSDPQHRPWATFRIDPDLGGARPCERRRPTRQRPTITRVQGYHYLFDNRTLIVMLFTEHECSPEVDWRFVARRVIRPGFLSRGQRTERRRRESRAGRTLSPHSPRSRRERRGPDRRRSADATDRRVGPPPQNPITVQRLARYRPIDEDSGGATPRNRPAAAEQSAPITLAPYASFQRG